MCAGPSAHVAVMREMGCCFLSPHHSLAQFIRPSLGFTLLLEHSCMSGCCRLLCLTAFSLVEAGNAVASVLLQAEPHCRGASVTNLFVVCFMYRQVIIHRLDLIHCKSALKADQCWGAPHIWQ